MRKIFESVITVIVAVLGLILSIIWYRAGHEIEPLIGIITCAGVLATNIVYRFFPEEKEGATFKNALINSEVIAQTAVIGDNNTVKIQQILGNLKEYQELEKALAKDQKLLNSIAPENQEARLQLSESINEKQETLDNIKKAIEQAFEYISKLTISTDRLDRAKALFLLGDIPSALEILKDEAIQADYLVLQHAQKSEEERHSRRMEEFAEKTKGIAEEWKMKAVLMATRYEDGDWFIKVKEYFQKALDVFHSNDTVLQYGTFLFQHNDIKGAIHLYENHFGENFSTLYFSENISKQTIIFVYNHVSNLYLSEKEFSKAKIFALKSLDEIRLLANSFPDKYNSVLPEAISLVAMIIQATRDYIGAEKLYLEALQVANSLSNANMENKLRIQAKIINDLAVVQKVRSKYDAAMLNYTVAIRKYKLLSKKNPNQYLSPLSLVQVNLANLYSDLRQNDKAEELYIKSIEIDRTLSMQNPKAFSLNLAKSLYNLAGFYQRIRKHGDADPLYAEAIEIIRLFVAEGQTSFNLMLSFFLNGYASCCYKSKNFTLSQSLYEEAIEIVTSLIEDNSLYLKELADLQNNLGLLLRDLEKINDAESFLLKASSNYEALLSENFEFISLPYAKNLRNLSELYLAYIPNHDKSVDFAKKSLKMYIPFLNTVPEAKENYELVLKIVARLGEDVDIIIKSIQTSSNE